MDDRNGARRKRQSIKRFQWQVIGFGLFLFILGFFFGRVVLAAERQAESNSAEGATVKGDGGKDAASAGQSTEQAIPSEEQHVQENEYLYNIKSENSDVKGPSEESGNVSIDSEEWNLILVNREHPMPGDYETNLTEVGDGHQVDSRIAEALRDMLAAGGEDGHSIWIVSSYRTMEKQTELYENKVAKLRQQGYSEEAAREEAGTVVAIPGTSEHQLGLAVDLVSSEYTGLDERQERTKSYQWLKEHCAEFGFILRYPNGKTEITGIIYEPWHFRYVGQEAAKEIMEREICLEEYLKEYSAGLPDNVWK